MDILLFSNIYSSCNLEEILLSSQMRKMKFEKGSQAVLDYSLLICCNIHLNTYVRKKNTINCVMISSFWNIQSFADTEKKERSRKQCNCISYSSIFLKLHPLTWQGIWQ